MNDDSLSAADHRRADIARKSAALFNESGYDRVSMDDIAKAVGLAKPSLYHYFRSKEEVLFKIHQSLYDAMLQRLEGRLAQDLSPDEQLLGVFVDIFESMDSHPGHSRVFFEAIRGLDPENQEKVRINQNRYEDLVRRILDDGVEQGLFAPLDSRLASLALFGMCYWSYMWYSPNGKMKPADLADSFFGYFVRGIARG